MRCDVHCPPAGSALGALLAAGAVVAVAYKVLGGVLAAISSVVVAVVLAEAAVVVLALAAVAWLAVAGRAARLPARTMPVRLEAARALPAPPKAIEGRVVPRGVQLGYRTASQAPATHAAARARRMNG